MASKFKIYIHNKLYLQFYPKKRTGKGKLLSILKLPYKLCFYVGLGIIKSFQMFGVFIKDDFLKATTLAKKTFSAKSLKTLRLPANLSIFFVLCLAGWLGLSGLKLLAQALDIKQEIWKNGIWAKSAVSQAGEALGKQNFTLAADKFALAVKTLADGENKLKQSSQALNLALKLHPQTTEAKKLLGASAKLAEAGKYGSGLASYFGKLKFSTSGLSTDVSMPQLLNDAKNQREQFSKNFSEAQLLLNDVKLEKLPLEIRGQVSEIKSLLDIMAPAQNSLGDIQRVITELLSGKKKLLVLFQNSNELRPTGGFWGTYGDVILSDGKIDKLNVSSIYDLDGQLKKNILPPHPILNVNDRWFLRDSNWFADFPNSAKKAVSFYEQSGGETPDMVMALTPQIVIDMLKITGPISLPKYGMEISAENFTELAEYATTLSLDLPENKPKQFIAELFLILIQKSGEFKKEQWLAVFQNLARQFSAKDILIYSRNAQVQNALEALGWSGTVKFSDRDYLYVVSSNLGGTKSDNYITQKLLLNSKIDKEGSIINELTITRTNRLPQLENTVNDSFLRVYVPQGSELLASTGFDYKNLDTNELQKSRQQDLDVVWWERNLVRNVTNGTLTGRESGKTFFGNWMVLKGGETKTATLSYRLPIKLTNVDRHSLLVQKQPGTLGEEFTYSLSFPERKIAWSDFTPKNLDAFSASENFELNYDRFFGYVMERF